MDDFGGVVYLDVEKTGSSFISKFLKQNMNSERVSMIKHGRIGRDYKTDTFYFISVRNPLDQYLSLFRYGCARNGAIYESLERSGHEDLYKPNKNSFQQWLKFVLSSKNAGHLGAEYKSVDTRLMGLQTFRFLALSFADPIPKLKSLRSYEDICELYEREKIHSEVVRNESLREDMEALVASRLGSFVDVPSAIDYLRNSPPINVSVKMEFDLDSLDEETMSLIRQKERFLLEGFYPEYL